MCPVPAPAPHTHVHVLAEHRGGPVLEAALVVHVIEDAGQHRGELNNLLGGRVIQALAPPLAAEMGQEDGVRRAA